MLNNFFRAVKDIAISTRIQRKAGLDSVQWEDARLANYAGCATEDDILKEVLTPLRGRLRLGSWLVAGIGALRLWGHPILLFRSNCGAKMRMRWLMLVEMTHVTMAIGDIGAKKALVFRQLSHYCSITVARPRRGVGTQAAPERDVSRLCPRRNYVSDKHWWDWGFCNDDLSDFDCCLSTASRGSSARTSMMSMIQDYRDFPGYYNRTTSTNAPTLFIFLLAHLEPTGGQEATPVAPTSAIGYGMVS